ncbi:MAG: sigma 54-interacting transcriptional regulator, partial [Holophagales bacterium]|nr:sigma 54-interacting transcriptional regulator [Holophagales bacterium]
KGAFTGAVRDRVGRFELAHGGTLFLDEVSEIPQALQSKLLRALQEGEFERVGESRTRRIDVRVIAATNRDLAQEMDAQRFRPDLYYRLNVFPIEVAPLRRRREDISLLAMLFVERACAKLNLPRPQLIPGNIRQLEAYDWPGNVRELQNIIERAVITSRGGALQFDLPEGALSRQSARRQSQAEVVTEAEMKSRERSNMIAALERTGGKIYGEDGAAALLGLKATTLAARLKSLGLKGANQP